MKITIRRICSMILCLTVALSMSAGLVCVSFAADASDGPTLGIAALTEDIGETEETGDEDDNTPSENVDDGDIEDLDDYLFVATEEEEYEAQTLPAESGSGTFRVQVPDTGYIEITNDCSSTENAQPISIRGEGDADYQTLEPDQSAYIGVKEGVYSFEVSTEADKYVAGVKFRKVSESAYGSKKADSVSIRNGKTYKGLFQAGTGGKQVHWYKFKNPKDQKVSFDVFARTTAGTTKKTVKVMIYGGKKHKDFTFESGRTGKRINIYNENNKKKLVKGTYYVKVVSMGDSNGYFSIKWN